MSQGASRENSISSTASNSIELPRFGDVGDLDDSKENISSSPEQETVLPKTESSTRPHVQNLFPDQKD